jgi:hypothetical protein
LGLAVVVFHSAVYKMGMEPPTPPTTRASSTGCRPVTSGHFAIQQEVSELLYHELVRVLGVSTRHKAQGAVP